MIKGLPIQAQSASGVYCSHVLEHMSLQEFRITLRNVFSYLRPGGVFRLVLPDIEYFAKVYVDDPDSEAAHRFMRDTFLGEETLTRGVRSLPSALFGRARHFWMWDYKAMAKELADAGFTDIRRAQFDDSSDSRFKEVEDAGRWENSLGVECRRA